MRPRAEEFLVVKNEDTNFTITTLKILNLVEMGSALDEGS